MIIFDIMEKSNGSYILGLDVSSSCIGISIYQDSGVKGKNEDRKLIFLHHVSPKVKPQPESKMEELFKKVDIFENEFLIKYKDMGIKKVVIEEPLIQSNNIYTVITLVRFNGMISKACYNILGIVPEFISSYDARKYSFEELMAKRQYKKDGTPLDEKTIKKNKPVLFGDYHFDVDKKMVIWEKISELHPQIEWFYDKNNKLKKENFDMSDSAAVSLAYFNMRQLGILK